MKIDNPTVFRGLNAFRQFLQAQSARFRSAPILLIESQGQQHSHDAQAQGNARRFSKHVQEACRHVNFLLSQQMGFRTVVSHLGHAFPTVSDVQHQLDLASRIGASTIVAVGSGNAIDLAKAAAEQGNSNNMIEELVLVPATYGATLVSTSSHSLLLDPQEEAIVVSPAGSMQQQQQQQESMKRVPRWIATLDAHLVDSERQQDAVFASIALLLDGAFRDQSTSNVVPLLQDIVSWLDDHDEDNDTSSDDEAAPDDNNHDLLSSLLMKTGDLISYGLNGNGDRSIPLALASSLLPKGFPEQDAITFMASLAPSLYQELRHKGIDTGGLREEHLRDAHICVTTEPLDTLMPYIHENQALWNCFDVQDEIFRNLLLKDHILVNRRQRRSYG